MSTESPPKPDAASTDQPPRLSPLGIAAACFGVCNLLGPPLAVAALRGGDEGTVILVAIGLGLLVAQFGVLPAWLVWGERPFWQRLMIHWALATALSLAWMLGLLMAVSAHETPEPPQEFFRFLAMMFLCLPAISLGIEAPLWVTRLLFGWRFSRPGASLDAERPLAIRDFLWGMAVVSMALAAGRLAGTLDNPSGEAPIWSPLAIAALCAGLGSAATLFPLVWCILRLENAGQGVGAIVVYVLVAGILILVIVSATAGPLPNDPRPVAALFLFLGSVAGTIACALGLARGAGYRLQIGRPGRRPG